jgi:hypothetical protein
MSSCHTLAAQLRIFTAESLEVYTVLCHDGKIGEFSVRIDRLH